MKVGPATWGLAVAALLVLASAGIGARPRQKASVGHAGYMTRYGYYGYDGASARIRTLNSQLHYNCPGGYAAFVNIYLCDKTIPNSCNLLSPHWFQIGFFKNRTWGLTYYVEKRDKWGYFKWAYIGSGPSPWSWHSYKIDVLHTMYRAYRDGVPVVYYFPTPHDPGRQSILLEKSARCNDNVAPSAEGSHFREIKYRSGGRWRYWNPSMRGVLNTPYWRVQKISGHEFKVHDRSRASVSEGGG